MKSIDYYYKKKISYHRIHNIKYIGIITKLSCLSIYHINNLHICDCSFPLIDSLYFVQWFNVMIQLDPFQWACILSNKRLFQSNNKTLKYLTNHVMNSFHLGYFHVTLFCYLSETLT